MQVLILFNLPVLPRDHVEAESEHEILETVAAVGEHLGRAGFETRYVCVGRDRHALAARLREYSPDVVFNLFEGLADDPTTEAEVAQLLERLGVPFTGCPARSLRLARSKHVTKQILREAGLPTPEFFVVERLPVWECRIRWPVLVKPALEDASIGIDQGSVVTDQRGLVDRVTWVLNSYGSPVLVEEFIDGREFNVALLETPHLQVLPISEILFVGSDPGWWPIVTYDGKWRPGSRDYEATPPKYPADVCPHLAARLGALACRAFRLLSCRDYARVDFRVTTSGAPFILEINPNPDFNPNACLAGALASAGISHAECTLRIVENALTRRRPLLGRRRFASGVHSHAMLGRERRRR